MNWKEVRDFLNTLTDEQLSQDAVVTGVEKEGGEISCVQTLDEDWVTDGEGAYPTSQYPIEPGDDQPEVCMLKGHVYIVFE